MTGAPHPGGQTIEWRSSDLEGDNVGALSFPEQIDWGSPAVGQWFLPYPRFEVRAEAAALLVIDMQNYAVRPDMGYGPILQRRAPQLAAYYYPRLRETVIPNNQKLLRGFRGHSLRVVFTRVGPQLADGSDLIPRRRQRDRDQRAEEGAPTLWPVGTPEHAIIDELSPQPGEYVFDKNTAGAFNSTAIEAILRNMGVESLFVTGVATEMCVETTARDASDRGFNVVLVEDGIATFEPLSHLASLYNFAKSYGMVRSADEVLDSLEDG